MKIKLNGNIASFISELNFDDLKAATKKSELYITDERGNRVYGVSTGLVGNINKVGVVFTHATSEGKAAFNIVLNDEILSLPAEKQKEYFLDDFSSAITLYRNYEPSIMNAIDVFKSDRAELSNDIEVG